MNRAFYWLSAFLLAAVTFVIFNIFQYTNGHFFYFLDDAYIHLALVENLPLHHGVQSGEVAAASSSILYPWLLVPGNWLGLLEFMPLLVNVLALLFTGKVLLDILACIPAMRFIGRTPLLEALVAFVVVLAANVLTLAFLGLEHSLHVLASLLILLGLIQHAEGKPLSRLFWLAVILNPTLRYEGLALSGLALGYLFLRGERKRSTLALGVMLLPVIGYSLYLHSMGLAWLPSSVLAKSPEIAMDDGMAGLFETIFSRIAVNVMNPRVWATLGLAGLLAISVIVIRKERCGLALIMLAATLAHLMFGKFAWFERYHAYIILLDVLTLACIWQGLRLRVLMLLMPLLAFFLIPLLMFNGYFTYTGPRAAGMIYIQQYQLHRFLNDYYQQKVLANDIGWLNFQSDVPVLDACGLSSEKVRLLRETDRSGPALDRLTTAEGAQLAFLYNPPDGCVEAVPTNWRKLARLKAVGISHPVIISNVEIYATTSNDNTHVLAQLKAFALTLPPHVEMTFETTP